MPGRPFSAVASFSSLCRIAVLLAALLALGAGAANAANTQPALVADLETRSTTTLDADPAGFVPLGDRLYFAATDPLNGRELWATDGTEAGTQLFIDLCPGPCSSNPEALLAFQGHLLWIADDGLSGFELWTSDGTAGGTRRLRDLCPGACSGLGFGPRRLVAVGNRVYFTGYDGASEKELWATDGTAAGTLRVAVLPGGLAGSRLHQLTAFAGALYFTADDGIHGEELWTSDGTAEGTRLAADLCPGACSSQPQILATTGNRMLVAATSEDDNVELWLVDPPGTLRQVLVLCNRHGSCPGLSALPWGDGFLAGTTNLLRIDAATAQATVLHSFPYNFYSPLVASGGRAFFAADEAASGIELWTSDGTPAGTVLVQDLYPGDRGSAPTNLTPFGGGVLFSAFTTPYGQEPWFSDGTAAGTHLVRDVYPGPAIGATGSSGPEGFTAWEGRAYFAAQSPDAYFDLWATDGTAAGTGLVRAIGRDPGSSSPAGLTAFANRLFFVASVGPRQQEPWVSDGTAGGTATLFLVPELGPVTFSPTPFSPFGDRLYFGTLDALWRTDGTPGEAEPLNGVPLNNGASDYCGPQQILAAGSRLFLLAQLQTPASYRCSLPGSDLFTFSGQGFVTPVSASPFQFIVPGRTLAALGDRLLLARPDTAHGNELWASDGTPAGTALLADLCPGRCSSFPHGFVPFAGALLFSTGYPYDFNDDSLPPALWRTDGTAQGTVLLRSFPELTPRQVLGDLVPTAGRVFFLVTGLALGDELWATDGTVAGTVRVSDLGRVPGAPGDVPRARRLAAVGNQLFLAVFHAATGEELWTSDGTAGGTQLVLDLYPGPGSGSPQELTAIDGRLFFAATDGISGLEPWVSNGTAGGTHRLADLAPGADSSTPQGFTAVGDRIYFAAADHVHGRELWSIPRSEIVPPVCQPDAATLCLGHGRFAVSVRWQSPNAAGGAGQGGAIPWSDETGLFWFFAPGNTELLVKLLDGGPVNGRIWFFSGALSDVAYDVTVRDLAMGGQRVYHNPAGTFCGQADTSAFPSAVPPIPVAPVAPVAPALRAEEEPAPQSIAAGCTGTAVNLCLAGGRFRVEVFYRDPHPGGAQGSGIALPGSDQTGYFWFFDPANLELAVKILDGRAVNGRFWVFHGALTDVQYTLTVTDTVTGAVRTYENPAGRICGGADVGAFPGS